MRNLMVSVVVGLWTTSVNAKRRDVLAMRRVLGTKSVGLFAFGAEDFMVGRQVSTSAVCQSRSFCVSDHLPVWLVRRGCLFESSVDLISSSEDFA